MRCSDFLQQYSDFRDGAIIDPAAVGAIRRHLRTCLRCEIYHNAVTQGLAALDSLGEIEPSETFRRELFARLAMAAEVPAEPRPERVPTGLAAAALLALAVAMLYEGVAGHRQAEDLAAAKRPLPLVVANPGVPFVSFTTADQTPPPTIVVPVSTAAPTTNWDAVAP